LRLTGVRDWRLAARGFGGKPPRQPRTRGRPRNMPRRTNPTGGQPRPRSARPVPYLAGIGCTQSGELSRWPSTAAATIAVGAQAIGVAPPNVFPVANRAYNRSRTARIRARRWCTADDSRTLTAGMFRAGARRCVAPAPAVPGRHLPARRRQNPTDLAGWLDLSVQHIVVGDDDPSCRQSIDCAHRCTVRFDSNVVRRSPTPDAPAVHHPESHRYAPLAVWRTSGKQAFAELPPTERVLSDSVGAR
jgi:hypothetical protein